MPTLTITITTNQVYSVEWALDAMRDYWRNPEECEDPAAPFPASALPVIFCRRPTGARLALSPYPQINADLRFRIGSLLVDMIADTADLAPAQKRGQINSANALDRKLMRAGVRSES